MLERLPNEVYLLILNELSNQTDLGHLCAVSKKLYELTLPRLYETVVISSESEKRIERLGIKSFSVGDVAGRLRNTKHISFSSVFEENLEDRCIHLRDIEYQFTHESDGSLTKFQALAANVLGVLQKLPDESLNSFNWELGTCIPGEILGSKGYLPLMQTCLEDLTLVTTDRCPKEGEDDSAISLSNFHALRRISWVGPDTYTPALRAALNINSKHLKDLHLVYNSLADVHNPPTHDALDRDEDLEDKDWKADQRNFFAHDVLGLRRSNNLSDVRFTELTSLYLGSVNLNHAGENLFHVLNISGLRKLALHECFNSTTFLRVIVESSQTLKLQSLEYQSLQPDDADICSILSDLLDLTPDLADLFVSVPGWLDNMMIQRHLEGKEMPLKRYVYHQRWEDFNEYSAIFGEEGRFRNLSVLASDEEVLETPDGMHLFVQKNLECLGLEEDRLFTAKMVLAALSTTKSLKLLHMRKSGPDMAGSMDTRSRMFERPDVMLELDSDTDDDTFTDDNGAAKQEIFSEIEEDEDARDEVDNLPPRFREFADWAFGIDGVPSLKVLAYGDFSFGDRFKSYNHILCRYPLGVLSSVENNTEGKDGKYEVLPYRPIRRSDSEMMALVNRNMDFLAACPRDKMLMKADD